MFIRGAKRVIIGLEVDNMKNVNSNSKVCKKCSAVYTPSSNRQLYCVECQRKLNAERCAKRYYATYVKKGYKQKRENNNAWKDGIGVYRHIKPRVKCELCGSTKYLLTHHIDRDRHNNDVANLQIVCKKCHQNIHVRRNSAGRYAPHA